MIIESFFSTRDEKAINIFELVVSVQNGWRDSVMDTVSQYGFVSFVGSDFCPPEYYLRERFSNESRSLCFNHVDDKSVHVGPDFDLYTLRRDYSNANDLFQQIEHLCDKSLKLINVDRNLYGRPIHAGYQRAICILLGIDHRYHQGDVTAFTQIWRVIDLGGDPLLITSVPAMFDPKHSTYLQPPMPEIWSEISSQEVINIFNHYNTGIASGRK